MAGTSRQQTPIPIVRAIQELARDWQSFVKNKNGPKGATWANEYFALPIFSLLKLIGETTGFPEEHLKHVAWYSDKARARTPVMNGTCFTPPVSDPDLDEFSEVLLTGHNLQYLNSIYEELRKCDEDGRTTKILADLDAKHRGVLSPLLKVVRGRGKNRSAAGSKTRQIPSTGKVATRKPRSPGNGIALPPSQTQSRQKRQRKRKRQRKKTAAKNIGRGPDNERAKPVVCKPLGIEVDRDGKTLCKGSKKIEFERCAVQWHIFNIAFTAFPKAYSLATMKKDYPGESTPEARKSAITTLNKKLKRCDLRIENRKLGTIR